MSHARPGLTTCSQYDAALHALSAARQRWAETSVNRRLALLRQIKDATAGIAPAWVAAAAAAKGLPAGDPLAGEEWLAGPCALMVGCNGLIATWSNWRRRPFCGGSAADAGGRPPGAAGGARHALGSAASVWCSR